MVIRYLVEVVMISGRSHVVSIGPRGCDLQTLINYQVHGFNQAKKQNEGYAVGDTVFPADKIESLHFRAEAL